MNWITPHVIYLNSAQEAVFQAVKDAGYCREWKGHVETTTSSVGEVCWAQARVVDIARNICILVRFFTSNKFIVETGWDNVASELLADRIRARLLEIQIGYESERRPNYTILPAPTNKILAPV